MDKRAAELTMNTIIIAVLVLIVLAVLLFMFSGKMNLFNQGLKSCTSLGGKCSGIVQEIDAGKTRTTCEKGVAIDNTDCGTMVGCCMEI